MAVDSRYAEGNITSDSVTNIVALELAGFTHVAIQLVAISSFSGTITFEGTVDNTTWVSFGVGTAAAQGTIVTTATGAGVWLGQCGGLKAVRGRCSTFSSGAVSCAIQASN